MLANKVTIIMHIVAYLFVICANAIGFMIYADGFKSYEIYTICSDVVFFFCILIFGLIVHTIVTKVEIATNSETGPFAGSESPILINAETVDVEIEVTEQEIKPHRNSLFQTGSVSGGIVATLFRQAEE